MEEYEIECTICREKQKVFSNEPIGKAYVFGCEKCKDREPANVSTYKPLSTGEGRPMTWCYQLDSFEGPHLMTNSITIFSRPVLDIDESGEHGYELFSSVTLTRAEIAELLDVLEEDIGEMRSACPGETYI